MRRRKAVVHITNQTGLPVLSGAICHKHGDDYRIECAWAVLQEGETTRVAYEAAKAANDWWVITWIDSKGGIYLTPCPDDMEHLKNVILKPDRIVFGCASQPSEIGVERARL
jgi:hypothetical protein